MTTNKLTLLACSGSAVAIALFAQPSESLPPTATAVTAAVDRVAPLVSLQQIDRHHELAAIDRVGCGCLKCSGNSRDGLGSGTTVL